MIKIYLPSINDWSIYYIGTEKQCTKIKANILKDIKEIGKEYNYEDINASLELDELIEITPIRINHKYFNVLTDYKNDIKNIYLKNN